MDFAEKIAELVSENELLQLQLGDLEAALRKKTQEIDMLGDDFESRSALQSRIDSNIAEIEQLRYNESEMAEKAAGAEQVTEELEISLLREIKENHKKEAALKKLNSVQTELEIITDELDETTLLHGEVARFQVEVAELRSKLALLESENEELAAANEEMKALLLLLKQKKFA